MALTKITEHVLNVASDAISEGSSNLFHTTARARGAVSVGGSLAYNSSTGVISFTQRTDGTVRGLISASGSLSYNNSTGVISYTQRTDGAIRGLVSVTDSGGDGSLAYNNSTGVITYTGPSAAEVRAHLSAGTGVTYSGGAISIGQSVATDATPTFGNTTLTGYLRGPASFTIDPATHGDDTGTVVIAGNLQVDGTTTTINSTTTTIDDLNLVLASGAANSAAANTAGITIDGASATLLYTHSTTSWDMNKPLNVTGNISTSGSLNATNGVGSNFYALQVSRSSSGGSAPDIWSDSDYVAIGHNSSTQMLNVFSSGASIAGTLATTGVLTANAGVVVDNITIDGTEIDLSSGDLTLDVAGDIILDAGGNEIKLKTGGTEWGQLYNSSSDLAIYSSVQDKDIKFQGNDNGSTVTALTLDMSNAGAATFNSSVTTTSFNNGTVNHSANQIQSGYDQNSDNTDLWINYTGYQGGTTYFRDFRVGNGKQSQLLFVDGSAGTVAVTNSLTVGGAINVTNGLSTFSTGTSWGANLTLKNVNDDAGPPYLSFFKDPSSGHSTIANNDYVGFINMKAYDGNGNAHTYIEMAGQILNASHGGESSRLYFGTWASGTEKPYTLTLREGKVGIGTGSPVVDLNIYNGSGWGGIDVDGTTGGELRLKKAGTTYLDIYAADSGSHGSVIKATDGLNILTNAGTNAMTIDDGQTVGIGIAAPTRHPLHIKGGATTEFHMSNNSSGDGSNDGFMLQYDSNNDIGFVNMETADMYWGVDNSTDMKLLTGGNLGIGTANPTTSRLQVHDSKGSAGVPWTAIGPGNIAGVTIANDSTTDNNMAGLFFAENTTPNIRAGIVAQFVSHSNGDTALGIATTNSSGNTREKMRFHGNGKIALDNGAYFVGVPTYGFRMNDSSDTYNNVIMYDNGNTYFRKNILHGSAIIPGSMASSSYTQTKIGASTIGESGHTSGSNFFLGNNIYAGTSNDHKFIYAAAASQISMTAGHIYFKTHDGGGASADGTVSWPTSRLFIKKNGYIGIGTHSPTAMLDIASLSSSLYALKIRGNIDNDGGYTGITFGYESDTTAYEKVRLRVEGTGGNVQPEFHILVDQDNSSSSAEKADAVISGVNNTQGKKMVVINAGKQGSQYDIDPPSSGEVMVVQGPLAVGEANSGSTGTASGRWIHQWAHAGLAGNGHYSHFKTYMWGGGSPAGNTSYIMGGFWIRGYHYGGGNCFAIHQFHNWGGSLYNHHVSDLGSLTAQTHCYVSTDGYVTLRLDTRAAYKMYDVDYVQYAQYGKINTGIQSLTQSSAAGI